MKTLLVTAALALTALRGSAQGQFTFGNKNLLTTPTIEAKMFHWNGTALAGDAYWAQAYVRLASGGSYAPVGTAVHFRTGANAGYIVSQVVTTPFPGGTEVAVEMRVWEAASGDSYEAAAAASGWVGGSAPVNLTVTVAPNTPPDMIGLQSFMLVPEPSPMALVTLSAAGLFLCRRR